MSREPIAVVADAVFERFPDYVVGVVIASGIDNTRSYPSIEHLLGGAVAEARQRFDSVDVKDIPEIACWRAAFGRNGWSPSRFPASVEALIKRAVKGGLPSINPIVDLANAASISAVVPIGAHDMAQFGGNALTVRLGRPEDVFLPMGEAPEEQPELDEIVYATGNRVRTRRWVWRQSREALVTPETRDVLFPIDGFADSTGTHIAEALAIISDAAVNVLHADAITAYLDASRPSLDHPH